MTGEVRVRFAPSPTGHLHVGGARTALFNWLYARHHGGRFILRIEDTDQARSTDDNLDAILDALRWLELDWDEGPPTPGYRQRERLALYQEHAQRLVAAGRAYYSACSREQLEAERAEAQARNETFRYSGRCRNLGLTSGALRLRIPEEGTTVVDDLIHGPVTFDHRQLDDWILVRSDGTPTYNFSVVVDDATMRISHVIRGNDHLSNTPKQVLCYDALGYPVPALAHVSMILGPDRTRLSKRHGATSVQAYREQGILPEAMVNYLARLGWSSGDQEIFSRAELVERFDIKDVSPSLTPTGLTPPAEANRFVGMLDTLRERGKTLRELVEVGRFYFERPSEYDARSASKLFTPAGVERLGALIERLAAVEPFTPASLEALYRELAEAMGLKLVDLAQLTRLAVTGRTASPPLFDVLALLGREETLARLRAARDAAAKAAR